MNDNEPESDKNLEAGLAAVAFELALEATLAEVKAQFYHKSGEPCRPYPPGYGEVTNKLRAVAKAWKEVLEQEEVWAASDN